MSEQSDSSEGETEKYCLHLHGQRVSKFGSYEKAWTVLTRPSNTGYITYKNNLVAVNANNQRDLIQIVSGQLEGNLAIKGKIV